MERGLYVRTAGSDPSNARTLARDERDVVLTVAPGRHSLPVLDISLQMATTCNITTYRQLWI